MRSREELAGDFWPAKSKPVGQGGGKLVFVFEFSSETRPGSLNISCSQGGCRFSLGLPVPAEEAAGELVAGEGELVTKRGGGVLCDSSVCDRSLHETYGERAFGLLSACFLSPERGNRWRR